MKIVAFLQNQWWKNPKRIKEELERAPDPEKYRRRLLTWGLSQCKTGKVLEKLLVPVIGAEAFENIYWENSSREFGGRSTCKFPPDPKHMQEVINTQDPAVILCFGGIAKKGLDQCTVLEDTDVLYAVHPASRSSLDTIKQMARDLKLLAVEWDG